MEELIIYMMIIYIISIRNVIIRYITIYICNVKSCCATAIAENGNLTIKRHNHLPDVDNINALRFRESTYNRVKMEATEYRRIYDEELYR